MPDTYSVHSAPRDATDHKDITDLIERSRHARTRDEQRTAVNALIQGHDNAPGQVAAEIRQAFLLAIERTPELLAEEQVSRFLAECIGPDDFARLQWKGPNHIVSFCETIYDFPYRGEVNAERLTEHVRHLMRQALRQLERQGDMKKMFRLLQIAPTAPNMTDGELLRLRNRTPL